MIHVRNTPPASFCDLIAYLGYTRSPWHQDITPAEQAHLNNPAIFDDTVAVHYHSAE